MFDSDTCDVFRKEISLALKPLHEKYGVLFKLESMRYMDNTIVTKLLIENNDQDAVRREKFNRNCRLYSLSHSDYGKEIKGTGGNYRLVGFNTRSSKHPLVGVDSEGREFKLPLEALYR